MQRPKSGGLLDLMTIHAGEDIGEEVDGSDEMRSLVEHHAFGALRHRGIGRLGPARQTVAHQIVEDLCRPDHGDAGRLAKPQHLFLNLGHAAKSERCGQIAPCNHDCDRTAARRLDDKPRQVLDSYGGFDFQDEWRQRLTRQPIGKMLVEQQDIRGPLNERETDQIRMSGDEIQIAKIV